MNMKRKYEDHGSISLRLLQGDGVNYGAISGRADRALAILDRERISSAPGIVGIFERDAGAVRSDPKLSSIGHEERIQGKAVGALGNIASLAKTVVELEAEYLADEAKALQLPPWSDTDRVEVDIALAGLVREQQAKTATDQAAREFIVGLARNASERMRLAVARLPLELSGLPKDQHDKVRHSLIPATTAARLDAESKAISAARTTVQNAIDYLTGQAQMQQGVLTDLFGDKWKYTGTDAATPEQRAARVQSQLQAEGQ